MPTVLPTQRDTPEDLINVIVIYIDKNCRLAEIPFQGVCVGVRV